MRVAKNKSTELIIKEKYENDVEINSRLNHVL